MKNLIKTFETVYYPVQALIVYRQPGAEQDFYVESARINKKGQFTSSHPLTVEEASGLAEQMMVSNGAYKYLQPAGILGTEILHLRQGPGGFVIWYTPPKKVLLLFATGLNIPEGMAQVPALLWKADSTTLRVFALQEEQRPTVQTPLYYAPFYNMDTSGWVCMGSVALAPEQSKSLEEFTDQWQRYFFSSYFTHLGGNEKPIDGDLDEVWKHLIATGEPFPIDKLRPAKNTLKTLL